MEDEINGILKYGRELGYPLILDDSAKFFVETIRQKKPKTILEIGTAIGYSGSLILTNCTGELVTVEKNEASAKIATENFARQGLANRVKVVNCDAKEFIDNCKDYIGKVLIALDYEVAINGQSYTQHDVKWCYDFIQNVIKQTGVVPLLYISKSLVSACDWSSVASLNVGLWFAQYADNNATGWLNDPWTDNTSVKPFTPVMQQYTGHGRINGYNANIDLSLFYGDTNAWNKYAKSKGDTNKVNSEDYLTAFARDVIAGKYGNGEQRKENIYTAIQNKVNELSK